MSVYDYTATTIDGKERSMADFKGRVLLIVNVASKCGFTPQYKGLEALYRRYKGQNFSVLGFPSDQFANQEPGTDAEIMQFCGTKYDVTFPMFAKIDVNGDQAHPLFQYLKSAQKGILGTESIKWNFTKFLVDADGTVLERYASKQTPEEIEADITPLLG
ncbi:MAG: glutathione peroxidase [Gemmatimonadetes bacterium]|nr:glutathione peroxidase [Gemmatimonadota bacterium]